MSNVLDNRYQLIEKLGDGGMATVYKAKDTFLDRFVAIKLLHTQFNNDSVFVNSFLKEAQKAAKLSHPNIVNIYDVGQCNDQNYIVMEYVEGKTLKEKLAEENKLSLLQIISIAKEICLALEQAHLYNLVHCDIKPHNILISNNNQVKVTDFGIARVASTNTITFSDSVVGSVHYFSPEQATGKPITTKSDIYSLGVLIYELLTGTLPFTGENAVGIAVKHLNETPRPIHDFNKDVPPILESIVMRALSKDIEQRPTSKEMLNALIKVEKQIRDSGNNLSKEDPFATRVMTPIEQKAIIEKLKEKEYIKKPKIEIIDNEENLENEEKNHNKKIFSFKYLVTLLLIIILGLGVGAFFSYGNFWSGTTVEVPNVVGMTQSQAEETLQAENLRVEIAETFDENTPAGKIVSQTPEAGKVVKENRLITIYISKGAEIITMPNLVGMNIDDATDELKDMGLNLVKVDKMESDEPEGTVLKQSITYNDNVSKGSKIYLTVARAKEDKVSVASVVGLDVEDARDILLKQGLNVQTNSYSGIVSAQSVDPGTKVDKGTTIMLGVSSEKDAIKGPIREKSPNNTKTSTTNKTIDNVDVPQRQNN